MADWRSKIPFVAKKRVELVLEPEQLTHLARVCLDIQGRCIEALSTVGVGQKQSTHLRHELFLTWLVTYQVTQAPNGIEHHLAVNHDGTIPPGYHDAILKDALRLLAYCVRVSRLMTTAPFDIEIAGVGVRRVLLPDQSKKLKRSPEVVPGPEALSALWTAACSEAGPLESRLTLSSSLAPAGLRPASS
ncbi:MAG: hypothetical protein JNJ54_36920 [Myxococcaceae bacterium]|nr:hypothetical protein [Myxococcaceae bacterium]